MKQSKRFENRSNVSRPVMLTLALAAFVVAIGTFLLNMPFWITIAFGLIALVLLAT